MRHEDIDNGSLRDCHVHLYRTALVRAAKLAKKLACGREGLTSDEMDAALGESTVVTATDPVMRVIKRKHGERIKVGDDIEITVLSISGGHVRLGVTVPRCMAVKRTHNRKTTQAAPPRPTGSLS